MNITKLPGAGGYLAPAVLILRRALKVVSGTGIGWLGKLRATRRTTYGHPYA